MKIKDIAALCKKSKSVILFNGESCQWVSNGGAIYPLFGLPHMDEENIFTMFDVAERTRENFYFKFERKLPDDFCFEDNFTGENRLRLGDMSICTKGKLLLPVETSLGMIYINSAYLKPFDDLADGYDLYERISEKTKRVYIAVKKGFILIGIIQPVDIISDEFIKELDKIYYLSKMALDNKNANIIHGQIERQRCLIDGEEDD